MSKLFLSVLLTNEYGDTREINLQLPGLSQKNVLIQEAERIANEHNPPPDWPVGVPTGTWTAVDWRTREEC
jgi:hypothetical protein